MTPEQAAALQAPFSAEEIGLLPRITCKPCSDAQGKVCGQHQKAKCLGCKGFLSTQHIHLDYVGHADVTKRLLDVDPGWTWEPVDPAGTGLPSIGGGMWIRLTVCGVTRYGFGDAQGKTGPNAVKEIIGDAIRNAAMRFGVSLDLWAKGDRKWSDEGGAGLDAEEAAAAPRNTEQPRAATKGPQRRTDPAVFGALEAQIANATDRDALAAAWAGMGRAYTAGHLTDEDNERLQAQWRAEKELVLAAGSPEQQEIAA